MLAHDALQYPCTELGDLRAALAAGPEDTFEQVVFAFQDRLYAFALHLLHDPGAAEEVVQDAFVRAYRALLAYDAERIWSLELRPWLYQITLNLARNQRRGRRIVQVSLDDTAFEPEARREEQPEQRAEHAERRREIGALVHTLPEPYRAAVLLRHVHGLRYPECATVLGQPVGTVKSHVHRGVALLRTALEHTNAIARREVVEVSR